jgi:hypothetical protein
LNKNGNDDVAVRYVQQALAIKNSFFIKNFGHKFETLKSQMLEKFPEVITPVLLKKRRKLKKH